ncbi:MAG: hypothetical protein PV340_05365 [Wolbachia sp.]|nr:hypothetical protein [Wolbachia sp.]MDD9335777.1 hypothetical protein [Wolbachia sp.]
MGKIKKDLELYSINSENKNKLLQDKEDERREIAANSPRIY